MDDRTPIMVAADVDVRGNPFAGRTDTVERPAATQPDSAHIPVHRLKHLQGQWDQADDFRRRRESWMADQRTAHAAKQAERDAAMVARTGEIAAANRLAALEPIRRRYLGQPGVTEADWDAEDHDALLRESARRHALAGDDRPVFGSGAREF